MSSVHKIDFGGEHWSGHRQSHWLEMAGQPQFPDYLRVVFVAYGRHAANGHAKLDRGELMHFLVRKDGTLPDRRTIHHAISKATNSGYLLPESRLLCLVVSSDHVQGGVGNPDVPCPRDHTIRKANDASRSRRFGTNDASGSGRSDTNDASGSRRSTLTPSLSSTNRRPAPDPHRITESEAAS